MMRAAVFTDFGAPVEIHDIDIPQPGAGEIRVQVHAASVNGFDLAVAAGYLNGMMEHRFPVVLGKDFAGVVDAIGPDVTGYQIGDRVFGVVTKDFLGDGSFAEYVTVPVAAGVAKLPDSVEFTEGAALGLAGAAAYGAVDAAALSAGQKVLIVGATGGVGNQAVQLAAQAGAHVIATAGTETQRELVTQLGAAETVDHQSDLVAAVRGNHPDGVDVVLHLAGDPATVLAAVRPGGTFVSTLVQSPQQLPASDATVVPIYTNPSAETLNRAAESQAQQRTRVNIQQTYPLSDAAAAFADFAAGTLGKLVIVTK